MYILHIHAPPPPVLSSHVFWVEFTGLRCWATPIYMEYSHCFLGLTGVETFKYLLPGWLQELYGGLPVEYAGQCVEEMGVDVAKVGEPVLLSQGDLVHELCGQLADHAGGEVAVVQG